ncbi:hypothetical protein MTR67_005879, partial [Solanum verrucosum]
VSVDSNAVEKKQWHLCRLESLSASASESSDFTSLTPLMVALMCMELWHVFAGPLISLPKEVRRPDNGSKTLSELKFQLTLCSYEIIVLILLLGIWFCDFDSQVPHLFLSRNMFFVLRIMFLLVTWTTFVLVSVCNSFVLVFHSQWLVLVKDNLIYSCCTVAKQLTSRYYTEKYAEKFKLGTTIWKYAVGVSKDIFSVEFENLCLWFLAELEFPKYAWYDSRAPAKYQCLGVLRMLIC